jgi:DNA-binding LytR/AlgR family response regulator
MNLEQHSSSASKQNEADRFTILLVEDNFLNRRLVKKVLEKNYIIKEAADAETAAEMLRLGKVHLAIIDIHLGNDKNDGIWLGEQVKKKYDIPFIYLTAFGNGDISQRAISTYPSSYITKPFKEIDLALSIEIALLKYLADKPVKNNWMLVKDGDYFVKLFTDSIDYFESTGNYLQVLSNGKLFKCRSTIKEILTLLPDNSFIQTHRAFVVNKNKIEKFNSDSVMVGGLTIPVSLKYANSLLF